MRTAPPRWSGRAGDKAKRKKQKQRSSTAVAAPVQPLDDEPDNWRSLGSVLAGIVPGMASTST